MISSIDRRRSIDWPSSSSSASVTAAPAARSSSSRRRTHGLPLLIGGGAELGGLALEPRLDFRDRLQLALAQPRELRLEMTLRTFEVIAEASQPLVEPSLDGRERVGEPLTGQALTLREGGALLFGQAPLLRRDVGGGVRAVPGERAPDLLDVGRRLLFHGHANPCTSCFDEVVDGSVPRSCAAESQQQRGGEQECGGEAGGKDPGDHDAEI